MKPRFSIVFATCVAFCSTVVNGIPVIADMPETMNTARAEGPEVTGPLSLNEYMQKWLQNYELYHRAVQVDTGVAPYVGNKDDSSSDIWNLRNIEQGPPVYNGDTQAKKEHKEDEKGVIGDDIETNTAGSFVKMNFSKAPNELNKRAIHMPSAPVNASRAKYQLFTSGSAHARGLWSLKLTTMATVIAAVTANIV